jgi:hypothetical protein
MASHLAAGHQEVAGAVVAVLLPNQRRRSGQLVATNQDGTGAVVAEVVAEDLVVHHQ